jgi:hypothetical protein
MGTGPDLIIDTLKRATLLRNGYAHRKVKPFFAYFLLAWTKSQAHVEARLDDLSCSNCSGT